MLVFKVAKFALRHPLLTHSASRDVYKRQGYLQRLI